MKMGCMGKGSGGEKGMKKEGIKMSGNRRRTKGLPTLKVASSEPVHHLLFVISIQSYCPVWTTQCKVLQYI